MPAARRRPSSTTQWWMACLARLLFALFVTGGALPAGGPSAVHGFDIVEEDETSTQSECDEVAVRQARRSSPASRGFALLEVPSVLAPTRAAPEPPIWMRPRRTPPPDDDDDATA